MNAKQYNKKLQIYHFSVITTSMHIFCISYCISWKAAILHFSDIFRYSDSQVWKSTKKDHHIQEIHLDFQIFAWGCIVGRSRFVELKSGWDNLFNSFEHHIVLVSWSNVGFQELKIQVGMAMTSVWLKVHSSLIVLEPGVGQLYRTFWPWHCWKRDNPGWLNQNGFDRLTISAWDFKIKNCTRSHQNFIQTRWQLCWNGETILDYLTTDKYRSDKCSKRYLYLRIKSPNVYKIISFQVGNLQSFFLHQGSKNSWWNPRDA